MEKNKNKKMAIVVAVLLVAVAIPTFAYFVATTLFKGNGSSVNASTATIGDTIINIEGTLDFNDKNILPGHKNVSAIKVTATGTEEVFYDLVWNGKNTLNTSLKYTVYKTTSSVNAVASCNEVTQKVSGGTTYSSLLYKTQSPRDRTRGSMPSSA